MQIVNCYSSNLDFNIQQIIQFQLPRRLDPGAIKQGTQTISAVFNMSYRGTGVPKYDSGTGQVIEPAFKIDNVKFSIIGPGWVKTKTHNITLEAGESLAGENYFKTVRKFSSESVSEFTPMEAVIRSIDWVIEQPKTVVGGRNFSTVSDCFDDKNLVERLLKNNDMYKLRRQGNYDLVKEQ